MFSAAVADAGSIRDTLPYGESMMTISRLWRPAGVMMLAMVSTARLEAQSRVELPMNNGEVVEVIGLRRWTVAMLQDSLARYSPGDSLQSHSCAAVLRYKLHFADAAAMTIRMGAEPVRHVVIVREPQDSGRVHYRDLAMDTTEGRPEWSRLRSVMLARPDGHESLDVGPSHRVAHSCELHGSR